MMERPEIAHAPSEVQRAGLRWCAVQAGYGAAEGGPEADAVAELGLGAFAAARRRPVLFPEALPTLRRLRAAGCVVGTITNGNADASTIAGLRDLVDFALTAEGVGAAKPDAAIFAAAMAAAGVSDPALCVHVGDDHAKDVGGAHAAGWRSIWCPAGQSWEFGGPVSLAVPPPSELGAADARVFSLAQIPAVLRGWTDDAAPARL